MQFKHNLFNTAYIFIQLIEISSAMRKIISVIYLAILVSCVPLTAQVTFEAVGGNISCDATSFCVDVEVTNFDSIVGLQFGMQWDTSIMQIDNFNTSLPVFSEFNTDSLAVGKIGFSWLSLTQPSLDLTDGTNIIQLCFEPNGSGTSDVDFIPPLVGGSIIEVTGIVNGMLMQNVPSQSFVDGSVTIADSQDPTITCPSDTIVTNGGLTTVNDIAPVSFMDDCSIPAITYSLDMMGNVGSGNDDASGTSFAPGTTTVTYTATDPTGNTGNCSFDVTIDNTNANGMLEFIPQVNFDCDNNTVSIDVVVNNFDSIVGMQFGIRWDMGILDFTGEVNNLPEVTNFNSVAEPGAILFTWAHFSSTPSSTSLPNGTVIFTFNYNLVGTLTSPLLSFEDFSPAIPILIGNEDGNLMQGVDFDFLPEVLTLIDNTDPTITCPAGMTVDTDAGKCAAIVDLPAAMAMDDCTAIDSITYTIDGNTALLVPSATTVSEVFTVGSTTVTYTAYDANANSADCSFVITVEDNEDPVITCPMDIAANNDTDACTANVELPFPTVSDNCGIDSVNYSINGTVTGFVISNNAMATFDVGTTTVTYTVFDMTGNSVDCSFDVVVTDAQDPSITCPTDIMANTDMGLCVATVTLPFPMASDNCGIDSISYSIVGVSNNFVGMADATATFPIGTTNVIYTAHSGMNTATCNFDVTVTDAQGPSITCPADITANTDMGACNATVTLPFPMASDNCGGIDSISYTIGGVSTNFVGMADAAATFPVGTTNVIYSAHSGMTTETCNFDVTITDDQVPTINCPFDFNVNTDFGNCTTTINIPFPTASDNCGVDSITYTIDGTTTAFVGTSGMPIAFPLGMNTVTYTAHSGTETATCSFNVNVNDIELPTIVCPSDTAVSLMGAMTSIVIGNIAPTVDDNCTTNPSISYALTDATVMTGNGDASGQSFNQGMTLVTYYVTDDNGNLDSCSFTVNVNVGLNIACDPNMSVNTDLDACSTALNFDGLDILSNPANITSIAYTLSAPSTASGSTTTIDETFNVGVTTVEYTVMDNMAQSASCSFEVTVTDNQAPTISCPSLDVTPNDPGSCDAFITIDLTPTVDDNCGIDSVTYVLTGDLTGSGTGTVPNMTYPVGVTTITYTAHDPSGGTQQCSFDVAVGDTEVPTITCPTDINMTVPMGTTSTTITIDAPTTTDNCAVMSTVYSYDSNDFPITAATIDLDFPVGTTTVTATVTDASGNPMTCTFDVTVTEGTLGDIIDCPADVFACNSQVFDIAPIYLVDESLTDVTFTIVGTNNSLAGIGDASGQTFEAGANVVTYTTTMPGADACSFTVTVDDEEPTFDSCPSNITAYTSATACQATVSWDVPIPMDNCGIALTIPSNSPPTTFPVGGPFTISYVTLDSASNQGVCTFDITVLDTISPSISGCPPADLMITPLSGTCGGTATWTAPAGSDNCSSVNVSSTHNPGDVFLTTTTVTYSFSDDFGNIDSCSFVVMIDNEDMDPPVIVDCPTDTIIYTDLGLCSSVYNWIEPTVTDDCSNAFINGSNDPGETFPLGLTTVTYIAFDEVGNEASCSFAITVLDTVPPMITCPDPILAFATDPNACGVIVDNWTMPAATDLCPGNVQVTCTVVPGDFVEVGTTLVTCTATDNSNNTQECVFTITVEDMVAPTIDCAGDVVVDFDGTVVSGNDIILTMVANSTCDSVQIFFEEPTVTDNCMNVVVNQTVGPANNTLLPIGELVNYKYVVTDNFGLQDSCEFSITVNPIDGVNIDASNTTFCAGEDVTLSVANPNGAATYTWTTPTGNVNGTTIDLTNASSDAAGDYTVVCDLNGCTTTDMVTLSIGEAPIINAFSVNPICNDDLDLMVAIDPLSPPIDSFRWTGPNGFTASIAQPTVPNAVSGDYTLVVYSSGCTTTDIVDVDFTVLNSPEVFSACNETICLGESCTLVGTLYDNPLIEYHWESVDGCVDPQNGSNTIDITPTTPGDCVIRYWTSVNDCISDTAMITISVIETPEAVADIVAINAETTSIDFNVIANDNINPNANFSIEATSEVSNGTLTNNNDGTFTYEPNAGFSSIDQFIYEVCYNCQGGLSCDNAIVTIESRDTSCTVPTVITPNGDDVNDNLVINCLESEDYPTNSIIIYNQWGDEVFQRSPYGNGVYWDGTHNGNPLPDGTYYYIFKLDPNAPVDRGYITIFR